jgi:hypothetical protein
VHPKALPRRISHPLRLSTGGAESAASERSDPPHCTIGYWHRARTAYLNLIHRQLFFSRYQRGFALSGHVLQARLVTLHDVSGEPAPSQAAATDIFTGGEAFGGTIEQPALSRNPFRALGLHVSPSRSRGPTRLQTSPPCRRSQPRWHDTPLTFPSIDSNVA